MNSDWGLHIEHSPVTILHVDDDREFGKLAATYLEKELPDANVVTETDPTVVLDTLAANDIDCVVSDFDMPEVDGISLLASVRAEYPMLPFILFTGKGSEEVAADAIDAGVTAYMQKETAPDQFTVLANKVLNTVESARKDEERHALRAGVEQVDSAIAVADPGGDVQYVNQRFDELTGISQQDVFDSPVCIFDVLGDGGFDEQAIELQLQRDGVWTDRRSQCDGGDKTVVEYRLIEVYDDDGGDVMQLVLRVAEKKGTHAMGFEADDVLRRINDGFFGLNTEWEFTYVNTAGEELLGVDSHELLGRKLCDVFPEIKESVFAEKYEWALKNQESVEFKEFFAPHNRTYVVRAYPSDSGLSVYFNEVSDQQRQDIALSELYEVTSNPNAVFEEKITDVLRIGREYLGVDYGMVNKVEKDTLSVEYISGGNEFFNTGTSCPLGMSYCREAVVSDGLLGVYNALEDGWDTDPVYTEFNLACYIGSKVVIENRIFGTVCFVGEDPRETPFSDEERQFVELLTQWVSYELEKEYHKNRLEAQNEYLRDFAGFVAHDLRNPLTVAEGRVELLSETEDISHVDSIAESLDRMNQIITDAMELARDGQQIVTDDKTTVSLCDVAEDAWRNVEKDTGTLNCAGDHDITVDEGKVKQLFENIFRNALVHVDGDVTVTVGATGDGGFYICDDGDGVAEDKIEKVFELGYTTDDDGTGLGLAIVERIANAHGWSASAENCESGGLLFKFGNVWVPENNELREHLNPAVSESSSD